MSIDWNRFVDVIHSHQKFVLTSHIRPDCDALGSELGMAAVLRSLGKDVIISNGHPTPPNLTFIDPRNEIRVIGQTIAAADLEDRDLLMILDTSAWQQLGAMADVVKATKAKKIVVDHHMSEDDLGAENFKNTQAEAAGRLVVEAADALGVALTEEIASPLFAAIATDTGWFRFGSASAGTYRMVARLIDAGAKPAAIYGALYEQDTLGRVKLRGDILSRIESELGGRLVHTYVLKEDFTRTGANPSDTEDVINMALAIAGTQFAVIFVEQAAGGFKISFRSRCAVDCSKMAERFNGGGHKAAAGASLPGELAAVQKQVLDAVRAAMQ